MIADHHCGVRVRERRGAGQKVKRCRSQGVLVCMAVQRLTGELFGGSVGDRAHRHIGGRQSGAVEGVAGNAEVGQQDSPIFLTLVGEQNIGGFDVSMQQVTFVGVVECLSDCRNDSEYLDGWHAVWVAVPQKLGGVFTVDIVHRDPQLAVVLTAVVDGHDVRMP